MCGIFGIISNKNIHINQLISILEQLEHIPRKNISDETIIIIHLSRTHILLIPLQTTKYLVWRYSRYCLQIDARIPPVSSPAGHLRSLEIDPGSRRRRSTWCSRQIQGSTASLSAWNPATTCGDHLRVFQFAAKTGTQRGGSTRSRCPHHEAALPNAS